LHAGVVVDMTDHVKDMKDRVRVRKMEEDERYREKMNEDENAGKCCEMLEEGE
jgi:hypothetical protein